MSSFSLNISICRENLLVAIIVVSKMSVDYEEEKNEMLQHSLINTQQKLVKASVNSANLPFLYMMR